MNTGALTPHLVSNSYCPNADPAFRKVKIDGEKVSLGTPMICTLKYSVEANDCELLINNKHTGSVKPLGPIEQRGPLIIGSEKDCSRFFFEGALAELMIFEGVLTDNETERIHGLLMNKYGIKSAK